MLPADFELQKLCNEKICFLKYHLQGDDFHVFLCHCLFHSPSLLWCTPSSPSLSRQSPTGGVLHSQEGCYGRHPFQAPLKVCSTCLEFMYQAEIFLPFPSLVKRESEFSGFMFWIISVLCKKWFNDGLIKSHLSQQFRLKQKVFSAQAKAEGKQQGMEEEMFSSYSE